MSFAQEIDLEWKPLETKGREIFNKKEVIKLFQERDDNNQLMEIAEDVFDFFKKQKFDYSFKYFSSDDEVDFSKIIITQAMTFVKEKDKFYLVKDFGEDFYSLPGGGCYLSESGEDCARREIVEEVQFEVDDLELLGTILVEVKKDNLVLSKTQQLRFLAKPKNVKEFELDPKMEIEERALVDFNSLKDKVMLLQNPTGEEILEDLKKRI
jgi:ADP-ribose pyrophosphatase YjhB (NUDIX family)